ncbi:hypothetical protein EMMF5_004994 [Cystobasidiomycetes sp. EMM_F5]
MVADNTRPQHIRQGSGLSFDGQLISHGEDLFASIPAFADEDDFGYDDITEDRDTLGELSTSQVKRAALKRSNSMGTATVGSTTAEKKATHNAVERARRESLNTRFLVLADLLPGMNHVKRASKAAIVNKSIDLIQELQATEAKLAKENEALKQQLNALKGRSPTGSTAMPIFPQVQPQTAQRQQHNIFALPSMQAQQPVVPVPLSPFGNMDMAAQMALFQQMHVQAQAQAQAQGNQRQASQAQSQPSLIQQTALPMFPGAPMPPYSTNGSSMFSHSLPSLLEQSSFDMANAALNDNNAGRNESASPISLSSSGSMAPPGTANSSSQAAVAALASAYPSMTANFFELAGQGANTLAGTSPASYTSAAHSPPFYGQQQGQQQQQQQATMNGSVVGSTAGSNSAPSPASSHSVVTPGNAYSPIPLPSSLAGGKAAAAVDRKGSPSPPRSTPPTTTSSAVNAPQPLANNDAAVVHQLATQFGPRDLQKAQIELQNFIAFQSHLAASGNNGLSNSSLFGMGNGSGNNAIQSAAASFAPSTSAAAASFFENMNNVPSAGNSSVPSIPAWQMMMAQQAALSAFGGASGTNGSIGSF